MKRAEREKDNAGRVKRGSRDILFDDSKMHWEINRRKRDFEAEIAAAQEGGSAADPAAAVGASRPHLRGQGLSRAEPKDALATAGKLPALQGLADRRP
jgi:hypothetical protein